MNSSTRYGQQKPAKPAGSTREELIERVTKGEPVGRWRYVCSARRIKRHWYIYQRDDELLGMKIELRYQLRRGRWIGPTTVKVRYFLWGDVAATEENSPTLAIGHPLRRPVQRQQEQGE